MSKREFPIVGDVVLVRVRSDDHASHRAYPAMCPAVVVNEFGGGCVNVRLLEDEANPIDRVAFGEESGGYAICGTGTLTSIQQGDAVGDWCWPEEGAK